ncbi:MAG: hypothetical protein JWM95_1070 [Gemmatimonadetes bacterium]|nr:hypothetical protein [Gemmatimonadota bacterium]
MPALSRASVTEHAPHAVPGNPEPSYRVAGAVSVVILLLYLATLAPTIGLWDAGEYIAAAFGFGIPHPPGNPGFVLLGRVASILPIAPTVAGRLNVLVAVFSALSAGLWFLAAEHVARTFLTPKRALCAAAAAALVGATAFTVWNQSVVNEKVYTLSLFLLALDLWATLRWQSAPDGPRADRRLTLLCYRLGLGYTIHIAGLLAGPALLAAVLATRPATLKRKSLMLACAGAFVLGLSPYVALPIRSAFRLGINEGHPTACEDGAPHWGCTVSRETLNRFLYENNRTQYAKPSILDRQQTLPNQVKMWWLYFKWQWFRDPTGTSPEMQSALAMLMLMLAGLGGYAHWRHERRSFIPFATLITTLTAGLIFYLNFKLGFSQALAMGITNPAAQEARDRDYFYLWSYSALSVWIALGLGITWRTIAESLVGENAATRRDEGRVPAKLWQTASPVLAIAVLPLLLNWSAASRRGETFAEDFAVDMLNSVEPNGVLFTGGDNDSFPLWFAQQVLGVRRDVTIVLLPYLSTDWYVRELIARTPDAYDVARGPALYRDVIARAPGHPVIAMSRTAADSIPQMTETFEARRVQLAGFFLDIPPASIPRDVIIMLRIIHDAGAERPIHFSLGAGSSAIDQLLKPHFLTQGLTRKLVPDPKAVPGAVAGGKEGYVDVPRAQALWKIFRGPSTLVRQGLWMDVASANTPYAYLRLANAMAEAMDSSGTPKPAIALRTQITDIATSMDFLRMMGGQENALDKPAGLGYAPVAGR